MHNYQNDTSKFIAKYLLATAILFPMAMLLRFCAPDVKEIKILTAPFLKSTEQEADSLLKLMSDQEIINQLIFFDAGKIDSVKPAQTKFGGIIYTTDSLSFHKRIITKIKGEQQLPALVSFLQDGLFPEFVFKDFPNLQTLNAVADDSISIIYQKLATEVANYLGQDFAFLPHQKSYRNDTVYTLQSIKNRESIIKTYQNKGVITCLKESDFFKNDSLASAFNQQIFEQGLSAVLLDNNADTSQFAVRKKLYNKHKFGGITLAKLPENNKNLQDTLEAILLNGAEMLLSKDPNKLIETINYLLSSGKITKEIIAQKAKKVIQAKLWVAKKIEPNLDTITTLEKSLNTELLKRKIVKKSIVVIKNKKNIIPYKGLKYKSFELLVLGTEKLKNFEKHLNYYHKISTKFIDIEKKDFIKQIKQRNKKSRLIIAFNNYSPDTLALKKIQALLANSKSVLLNFKKLKNIELIDSAKTIIQAFGNSNLEQQYAAELLFGGISVAGRLPEPVANFPFGKKIKTKKTRISQGIPEEVGAKSEILAAIDSIALDAIRHGVFPGCQVFAIKSGQVLWDKSYGYQTYSRRNKITADDIYDIASLTKIAGATLAAMKMFDTGKMHSNDVLGKFFRDTKIEYTRIKPDTIINLDTLFFEDIKNWKKLLRHQDTVHINDSMFLAYDTLIVTATPRNNIFKVKLKHLLTHSSGISPSLPILPYLLYRNNYWKKYKQLKKAYEDSLANGFDSATFNVNPRQEIQKVFDNMYTTKWIKDSAEVQIAKNFYLQNHYFDTLWRDTKQLRVYSRRIYQYSDVNMILLQQAIDSANRKSIDRYLKDNFYKDLGLQTIGYKPLKRFPRSRIVPTENEKFWRKQLLLGYVHDPSAALLGGVSGNAGLFTNAHDLGIIGQMWLNGGSYGGKTFLSRSIVNKFTRRQEDSHRGLGFNKPGRHSIIGDGAPKSSYGHTGFTGTCMWIDPENEIVYIFLSNRVHPSAKNWRINRYKIRQKIHTEIYKSIK